MKLLIVAYRETGDPGDASALSKKLRDWKVPSIEEALVSIDPSTPAGSVAARN